MRHAMMILALLLAGCASPALMTPEQLPAGDEPALLCTQVTTLAATVRTVYVRGRWPGTTAVGPDCTLAAQAPEPAASGAR